MLLDGENALEANALLEAGESLAPLSWRFLGIRFLLFLPGTCPKRSEMAVGFTGTDFQAEPSILDPFRTIFGVFVPT